MRISEEDASDLKIWVMRKLEDISDADSDVLADYVLALIRSDVSNSVLRDSTILQLEDFLREHAASFVDELLCTLANRTYTTRPTVVRSVPNNLKINAPLSQTVGSAGATFSNTTQVVHNDELNSEQGRKRGMRDVQAGSEQFAISQSQTDTRFKRKRGGSVSQNGRPSPVNPRHVAKGPVQSFNTSVNPFNINPSIFPLGDPQTMAAAMLSMQAMSLPASMNSVAQESGNRQPCLDYETQGLCIRGANCPYDHGNNQIIIPQPTNASPNFMNAAAFLGASNPDINGMGQRSEPHRIRRSELSMPGPNHNRNITTVVVEQIPEENFEEDQVHVYFERFGQIDEISMQAYKRLAIVKYSHFESAKAAYESPRAIFDNRFVKVYWCKADRIPKSRPGSVSTLKKEASTGEVPNEGSETEFNIAGFEKKTAEAQQKFEERNRRRQELEMKNQKIDQQRRELEKITKEAKMKLDNKMRKLGLDPSPDIIRVNGLIKTKKQRDADSLRAQFVSLEAQARELGLNLHTLDDDTLSEGFTYHAPYRGRGRYYSHRGHWSSYSRAPYPTLASRSGFRGRGGYRGAFRGAFRGAVHADGRDNLDLRPRRIRLTALDEEQWSEDRDEALREHLFNFGEFECIESVPGGEAGDAIVTFKDRRTAEAFYHSPRDVPNVGSFHLAWISDPAVTTESAATDDSDDVVMDDGAAGRSEPDYSRRDETKADTYNRHNDYDAGEVDERWIV